MRPVLLPERAFFDDIFSRIPKARRRVYTQFMSFEGDKVGLRLSRLLIAAKRRGLEVRVIIDDFTDKFIADAHVMHPLLKKKARQTVGMIKRMKQAGIPVVRTRPFGRANLFFLFRNHKKIMIIDDQAYVGGHNITSHNMEWHDFMARMDDSGVVGAIAEDFLDTCRGKETSRNYKGIVLTNKELERRFDALLAGARREIIISSPYLAGMGILKKLALVRSGVDISVYTVRSNNQAMLRLTTPYVLWRLAKRGVQVRFYRRFSHAKFLIIDGEKILFGSSNYGTESFRCKEEIGICLTDRVFVRQVRGTMIRREKCDAYKPALIPGWRLVISAVLAIAGHVGLWMYSWALRPFVPTIVRS